MRINRHKFKAVQTVTDGIKFPSKKEANRYLQLKMLQRAGNVVFFLRQVPFDLPGNTKYFVDFQIFYSDGTVTFEDVKGMLTPAFVKAKKQVESLFPVEILVI